tara:strand:+ start:3563 stop:3832 length:270 start_codon:yes stop_codon:yes gene_type:complete
MAVYIDKANIKYKRMIMCHMIADSYEELHYMAKKIGMKSAWFQNNASFPHYDVCLMRKKKALEYGAIEVSRKELVIKMREFRKKYNIKK